MVWEKLVYGVFSEDSMGVKGWDEESKKTLQRYKQQRILDQEQLHGILRNGGGVIISVCLEKL